MFAILRLNGQVQLTEETLRRADLLDEANANTLQRKAIRNVGCIGRIIRYCSVVSANVFLVFRLLRFDKRSD